MSAQNKLIVDWEKFREGVRKSTSINLLETAEEKKKRIAMLEADPQAWKQYYFPKYFKYQSPEFHLRASKRLLKQFKKNKHWYEVRHWARGLSKSTTVMFDVLYLVLVGQEARLRNIILISSTYDAAEGFLTKYMAQLDSNQRIINDYGRQELPGSWTLGNFTTREGAKFMALGARQSPRGNGNEEIRPDCIIVDDFDTDEECRNPDIINQKWDWFEKAVFFTVDTAEPYLIIWIGNIIAEDCCVVRAGKIADHMEVVNIRDENNKSVWPEKNSEEDIDYQLSKVSYEAGQQELFNNPIRQGQTFKELTYGKVPRLQDLSFAVVYADPAPSNRDKPSIKSKMQNSAKCVSIVGYYNLKFYVFKTWLDNTTNANFVDWLYAARAYINGKCQAFYLIENNTLQNPHYEQVLLPLIFSKGKEVNDVLGITPDQREKPDKWVRIEGTLEPLNRLGNLILNQEEKENPHMKRLEAQFKAAGATCKTMDGPDCIEGGVHIIKNKIATTGNNGIQVFKRKPNNKRF
jgi:hypothetical protein